MLGSPVPHVTAESGRLNGVGWSPQLDARPELLSGLHPLYADHTLHDVSDRGLDGQLEGAVARGSLAGSQPAASLDHPDSDHCL